MNFVGGTRVAQQQKEIWLKFPELTEEKRLVTIRCKTGRKADFLSIPCPEEKSKIRAAYDEEELRSNEAAMKSLARAEKGGAKVKKEEEEEEEEETAAQEVKRHPPSSRTGACNHAYLRLLRSGCSHTVIGTASRV